MLTSASPTALQRVAVVGRDVSADVQRCGRRLSEVLGKAGASAGVPPTYRSLGDDLLRLSSSWSALEAWVGRVGDAFERADAGDTVPVGPPAPRRVVAVPETALGVTGDGPTWVDALSDTDAEGVALRLAAQLRPVADRLAGAERARVRADVWPLVRRLRERWPEATIQRPPSSSSSACAPPPPRSPDGLEDALELLHLAGPGRVPHTAGVAEALLDGFLGGEAASSYDNLGAELARTAGHVASGVMVFGDVRDAVVEGRRGNWPGVALAAGGLVPGAGDFFKGGKAIDDLGTARRVAIDLADHDDWGGHGLFKHVGLEDEQLYQRLVDEPWIPAASTFADVGAANRAAAAVVDERAAAIDEWLAGSERQLKLERRFEDPIGRVVPRGADPGEAHFVTLVIRRSPKAPAGWYIHTMLIDP